MTARASGDDGLRERVRDDLKGLLRGDLLFDELDRVLYSTDASLFQVEPLGVVAPRDEDDLATLVRYAGDNQVSLVPRGAGTGLAGEALGPGVVVDMSRHFRQILDVGGECVRVQPGVVWRALDERLAAVGRRFAPDPASGAVCTLGGMVATDASGSNVAAHGYTRDHVLRLRVVLDSGDAAAVGREPAHAGAEYASARLGEVVRGAADLLAANAAMIHNSRPGMCFDRCGYRLDGAYDAAAGQLDLARLVCGSEGTLAFVTEATLRTVPRPGGRAAGLYGFVSIDAAVRAADAARPLAPAACDLLDRRLVTLAKAADPAIARLLPPAVEAVLLVEFEGETPADAADRLRALTDAAFDAQRLAVLAHEATDADGIGRLWRVRDLALPRLDGLGGGERPVAIVEDVGVPPDRLGEFLAAARDVLRRHETSAAFLVHAAAGQVETRPFFNPARPDHVARMWAVADELYGRALEMGGTVSARHGVGLARTPWVAKQFGPLYGVFRQLKRVFDPRGILNPGKIVGPDPSRPAWPLRTGVESAPTADGPALRELPVLHLNWSAGEVAAQAAACQGCGACRTEAPAERMCPVFRAVGSEAATPRAKANLVRHLLQPGTDPLRPGAEDVRAVARLCVNCRMCKRECPSQVDVPRLMIEAKAAHLARHGLDRADWVLARADSFAAFGSRFALATNPLLGRGWFRWLLESIFGVARKRRLPTFAVFHFLIRARWNGWTKRRPTQESLIGRFSKRNTSRQNEASIGKVAYFADVYATYIDPQIAEAAVLVLKHQGLEVVVPPGQTGCGMAALAQGDVEAAREAARVNLRALADLAREGYDIVCSEPTAALMLRDDYPDLIDDADARLVSGRAVELTDYLAGLHADGKLKTDFKPLEAAVGHHVPCHVKALGRPAAGPGLLALIPGLAAETIDVSCSGMAGTFGLKAENYETSQAIGRPMLERLGRPDLTYGSTECSACRMQMEDGAGKRTLHPVQYLALAYGLMPELSGRLKEPLRPRTLR